MYSSLENGLRTGASVEQLELATVLNVSQTISREIVLERLVETVLRTAVEDGGAERGLLLQPPQWRIGSCLRSRFQFW
jgi:hypothetical protein